MISGWDVAARASASCVCLLLVALGARDHDAGEAFDPAQLSDRRAHALHLRGDPAGDAAVLLRERQRRPPVQPRPRAVVYQRAKMQLDVRPFGTHLEVYGDGYEWMNHSIAPRPLAREPFRISIGGPECTPALLGLACSTSRP